MMILFVVLSFVMVFILIWQQIQHKKLVREIDYITSRLDTISVISENGFVLIPTDNDSIKKLSAALNKLLQDFYTKKSQFEQSKQAMAKVLTNISHDIRTPLTVLKGNSEMLSNSFFVKTLESILQCFICIGSYFILEINNIVIAFLNLIH